MTDSKQVPPPIGESGSRLRSRPYESDFSRLPRDETMPNRGLGAGPRGTIDDGPRNWPLVVVTVGFAVIFLAFGLDSPWPVAVGLGMIVVGAVWSGIRNAVSSGFRGTGTVRMEVRDERDGDW